MSEWRGLSTSPLWQLTRWRTLTFLREPEAVFWVFAFPVLMALALGIAFRNQGPETVRVGIEEGPHAARAAHALAAVRDLEIVRLEGGESGAALRRGRVALLLSYDVNGDPVLAYDPGRPETRLARLAVHEALERAAGRADRLRVRDDTVVQVGARYIDFLIPGLVGLNLLGTGMWGIGFPIATARQQKLLKRMLATPMRRSDYLASFMLSRLVWLLLEVVAVVGFGWIAFGVGIRGSWLGYALIATVGAMTFSALGLLVASRARTIEAVSGLMNAVMLPMWLLSGTFFSAERFPAVMQPLVQALPLTIANNALRALTSEGAGLAAVGLPLAALALWGVVAFVLALRLFRWE